MYGLCARVLGRLPHALLLGLPHLLPRGLLAHLRVRRLLRQPLNACPRLGLLRRLRAVPGDGLVLGHLRILLGLCGLLRGLGGLPGRFFKLIIGNFRIDRRKRFVECRRPTAHHKSAQRAAQRIHANVARHIQYGMAKRFALGFSLGHIGVNAPGELGFLSADYAEQPVRRLIDDGGNALFAELGQRIRKNFFHHAAHGRLGRKQIR